jgi:hypothetical protein
MWLKATTGASHCILALAHRRHTSARYWAAFSPMLDFPLQLCGEFVIPIAS